MISTPVRKEEGRSWSPTAKSGQRSLALGVTEVSIFTKYYRGLNFAKCYGAVGRAWGNLSKCTIYNPEKVRGKWVAAGKKGVKKTQKISFFWNERW